MRPCAGGGGGVRWPPLARLHAPPPLPSTGEWGLLHTLHCKLKHTTRLYNYHTSTTPSLYTSTRTKQHTLYLSHILNKQHMQTATHTQTRTNFFNKWSTNPIPAHTTNTGSSTPNVCTHTPPPPPQHWQLPPPSLYLSELPFHTVNWHKLKSTKTYKFIGTSQ